MKRVLSLVLIAMLALASMCAIAEEEKTLKVGFSESTYDGAWRVCEVEDFKAAAEKYGYELIITNANNDIEKQLADVDDLIAQECDIILIVPVDANAVAPAFNACKEAGIPVIDLDTQYLDGVWGEDFITTVRSDQYKQGEACAQWVLENFADVENVKILEITGNPGQSDAQNRSNGFNETLQAAGFEYELIQQNGEWARATAQEIVQNVAMSADGDFNIIYTHADEMALGCILGLKQAGLVPNEDVYIVTVDGQYEALDAMIANELAALITCSPRGGELTMGIIEKYFAGEELEETYFVDQKTVTVDNVEELYDEVGF